MNLARITYLQEFSEKRKRKNWDCWIWPGPESSWRQIESAAVGEELPRADLGRGPAGAPDLSKRDGI
jgi:hypothetical protein